MTDRARIDAVAAWMGWTPFGDGDYFTPTEPPMPWRPLTRLDDIALVEAEIERRGLMDRYFKHLLDECATASCLAITAPADVRFRAVERVIREGTS